jgi:hypothetical protein
VKVGQFLCNVPVGVLFGARQIASLVFREQVEEDRAIAMVMENDRAKSSGPAFVPACDALLDQKFAD